MVVGISSLELFLPENHSLKEKRHAVKKVVEKTRAKFNISIMEIDPSDLWQRAKIGFSVVGLNRDHVNTTIENIRDYIESLYIGTVIDTRTEIIVMGNEI
ncbi:MAG: DUF503 domain-containing protein [Syntrophorhabdaceae bacterium]|nr:DUF503 domain-containing protein [Syntrophorhabdaceae bacterium]